MLLLVEWLAFAVVSLHLLYLLVWKRGKDQTREIEQRQPMDQQTVANFTLKEIITARLAADPTELLLEDVALKEFPVVAGLNHVKRLYMKLFSADMDLSGIQVMRQLNWLKFTAAAPLKKLTLTIIENLPQLTVMESRP